jgi:putative FmdB family regulatory protein
MPIYEYRCEHCDLLFEKIVFGSSTRIACPACGAEHVERQPSVFGIGGSERGTNAHANCGGCKRSSCAGCH